MWIFTKYGFFSAVRARQGDGKHGQPIDPHRVMVPARVRGHLEALMKRFPDLLGPCEIREFPRADYAFRIFVDKRVWSAVLSSLPEDTDYDNFKSVVARHQGRAGAALRTFAARRLVGDVQVAEVIEPTALIQNHGVFANRPYTRHTGD
jgi:hypothetical protein